MYELIETHAHLDEIENLKNTIETAGEVGVVAIVAVGQDYASNRRVLEIAREYEGLVYPALGLHPWNISKADMERDLAFMEEHINEAVGIGEIGLDYHKRVRALADKNVQKDVLRQILEIAARHEKPVTVHSRYAWRDAFDLVHEAGLEKAVFHWYTGTSSVLRDIVGNGYYLSATPAVEYHDEHRRAIKEIPPERLMLETDCPVVYRRGTEDEFEARPADVLRVLKAVSLMRGTDEETLAKTTTANARRFLGI